MLNLVATDSDLYLIGRMNFHNLQTGRSILRAREADESFKLAVRFAAMQGSEGEIWVGNFTKKSVM